MSSTITQNLPKILTKRHIGWGVMMLALICGIVFLVNGPFSSYFASSTSAGEDLANSVKPLPVNVADIEFVESITQTRSYTGTVRARRRSDLGFELPGKIESINVDEGDTVSEGQVLAGLDIETLDAQRGAETAARLAQANAVLDELNAGPRPEKIKAAKATMEAAESQLDNANSNLERRELAFQVKAISPEEINQARATKKTARANFNAAQQQLIELEAGTRKEKLTGQRSVVRQLEAEAKEIEVAIAKSKLIAPFAGTVTRRYLDPGSVAPASVPVIKLVEQQHLEAWIGLPVDIVAQLELGCQHNIFIGGKSFEGNVLAKISELDPTTRTQTVLFEMKAEDSKKIVSGQLCKIQISSSVDEQGCWIPTSALAKGIRGLWSVLVIVPDELGQGYRVEKRDIEIIKTDSNRVLAKGTIQSGDRIVVNGVHRIGEGQFVVPSDE